MPDQEKEDAQSEEPTIDLETIDKDELEDEGNPVVKPDSNKDDDDEAQGSLLQDILAIDDDVNLIDDEEEEDPDSEEKPEASQEEKTPSEGDDLTEEQVDAYLKKHGYVAFQADPDDPTKPAADVDALDQRFEQLAESRTKLDVDLMVSDPAEYHRQASVNFQLESDLKVDFIEDIIADTKAHVPDLDEEGLASIRNKLKTGNVDQLRNVRNARGYLQTAMAMAYLSKNKKPATDAAQKSTDDQPVEDKKPKPKAMPTTSEQNVTKAAPTGNRRILGNAEKLSAALKRSGYEVSAADLLKGGS